MSLAPEEIKKIAHLARLNISDSEIESYVSKISQIIDWVEQINQADTDSVLPMAHPLPDLNQRLRADEVTEDPDPKTFQEGNAPSAQAGLYLVPTVIEDQ